MRNLRATIVAAALLATVQGCGSLPASETSAAQAAEVKEQQETVNLVISGMT